MQISDLRINANTSISNNAIQKQQAVDSNYKELEVYNVDGEDKQVTSVGMFAKLNANENGVGAVVKNLTLNIAEVYGTGVNYVGSVAGQVIDSMIFNITVNSGKDTAEVSGLNAVGAIAGKVTGSSTLVNLTSNISITANYHDSYNRFNAYNNLQIAMDNTYNVYNSNKDDSDGTIEGVVRNANKEAIKIISNVNTVSSSSPSLFKIVFPSANDALR